MMTIIHIILKQINFHLKKKFKDCKLRGTDT